MILWKSNRQLWIEAYVIQIYHDSDKNLGRLFAHIGQIWLEAMGEKKKIIPIVISRGTNILYMISSLLDNAPNYFLVWCVIQKERYLPISKPVIIIMFAD